MSSDKSIPKDLQKVHAKYAELVKEKGEEFANGFLDYMVKVDYEGKPRDEALRGSLALMYSHLWNEDREDLFYEREHSDLVDGFNYGEEYAHEKKYTYQD